MLVVLQQEIDRRARTIASAHGDWPCRAGCDFCCRNLAEQPRLTPAEWELVARGLSQLAPRTQLAIRERAQDGGRICPFLNRELGQCMIYNYRPIACRTYGFYVERDRGLYCKLIEERVAAGEMEGVVWGNVAGIEARLEGEKIPLSDWLRATPGPAPTRPSDCPDPCDGQ